MTPEAQTFTELEGTDLQGFSVQWELFCAEVASGNSAEGAAVSAGFAKGYGYDLKQRPEVQARIKELLSDRAREGGLVPKLWLECRLVQIVNATMSAVNAEYDSEGHVVRPYEGPNYSVAQSAIMNIARLKGWIIEKKQTAAMKVNVPSSKVALAKMLEDQLSELAPGDREHIRGLASGKSKVVDAI